jgi:hypothetical protein
MALQFAVAHSAMVRGVGLNHGRSVRLRRHDPLRVFVVCLRGHADWHDSVGAVMPPFRRGRSTPPYNLERIRGWGLAEEKDPIVRRAAGEGGATCMLHCMDAGKAPPG